ncbi:MAG: translation initiation factor IF-2 [Alphaproteobacteria bacterium]
MSDTPDQKDTEQKKPLTLSSKLGLKDLKQPTAKGKSVIVEVKRSRLVQGDVQHSAVKDSQMRASHPSLPHKPAPVLKPKEPEHKPHDNKPTSSKVLTGEEREARLRALKDATDFVEKKAAHLDESSKRSAELRQQETEKEAQKQQEIEEALATETAAVVEPEETVQKESSATFKKEAPEEESETAKNLRHLAPVKRVEPRRAGKITITSALSDDAIDGEQRRSRSLASLKRAREKERLKAMRRDQDFEKISREVTIPETITVQELANRMAEKASDVIKCFMKMGMLVTVTQSVDADSAQLVVEEMGHKPKRVADSDVEDILQDDQEDTEKSLEPRCPVVTIMGHVDHGKTSLLDALRTTDVVSTEAGGITQHIGAYQVTLKNGGKITFIDTPGHAAFTEMRSRGANVTDIVVLVVAADDGIKDQTIEAIRHAKAAKVPIIVAINKIDKPEANPDRVRQALMQHEIYVEELGGDVLCVEVSAKQKTNLNKLEETILLQAELMNLRANPHRPAVGAVIESRLEKGRGPIATTLIQKGTLKIGDYFVAGAQFGRVRALIDHHGVAQKSAGPSTPIEIIGFNGLPGSGDILTVTQNESKAREIAEYRQSKVRGKHLGVYDKSKMDNLFAQHAGGRKELDVLIKADVHGSAEAITSSLKNLAHEEVGVKVLHMGIGGITETDISLAKASKALIIGFNVRANTQARELAQKEHIQIRYYSIIYDVINDIKALLTGLLSPVVQDVFIGRAEIRKVFKISSLGNIAGCHVTEGVVKRGSKVRLLRNDIVIHEGKLKTLKRIKDEVKEVKNGFDCGMAFENYDDIREGDIIECSEVSTTARQFE